MEADTCLLTPSVPQRSSIELRCIYLCSILQLRAHRSTMRNRGGVLVALLCVWLPSANSQNVQDAAVAEAANTALQVLWQRNVDESTTDLRNPQSLNRVSPPPSAVLRVATPESTEVANMAKVFEEVAVALVAGGASQSPSTFRQMSLPPFLQGLREKYCDVNFTCNPNYPYRTPDGSCNNLHDPGRGKTFTCMRRLLPSEYADGIREPRVAKSGNPLPNARRISFTVHANRNVPSPEITHLVMQFGQIVDHDLVIAPQEANPVNPQVALDCCLVETQNFSQCFPIPVPEDDPFYRQFGTTCLPITRSQPCSRCVIGPREQQVVVSSYMDASQIYGSSQRVMDSVRLYENGLLAFQLVNNRELLPGATDPLMDRCTRSSGQVNKCFLAGDVRVNEQPALMSLHVIWLRRHNDVARTLQRLNPSWDDERLFQEARRVIAAQFQIVMYTEWLLVVLGPEVMAQYGITPLQCGFSEYNAMLDATPLTEFATAAYRVGHTLIQDFFMFNNKSGEEHFFPLKENYFFPFRLYDGELDPILRGLTTQSSQTRDRFMVDAVTNQMYRLRNEVLGLDLAAINIQRGRDHGIKGYVEHFEYCTGNQITSFDDLRGLIPDDIVDLYAQLYEDVRDIDLFSAGITEIRLPGSLVGPVFACIMGETFHVLKFADRFFYEHGGQVGSFTEGQLKELRKTTFAKILCDYGDDITHMQKNAFRLPSDNNPVVCCQEIQGMSLDPWKE
ncbi:peroxidase-like [Ornithodoros turicata]|uniref:peroxidase-like n=1 Tax=Ornithodoros turicata TaxID=34597 RepID=UPI003138ED7A